MKFKSLLTLAAAAAVALVPFSTASAQAAKPDGAGSKKWANIDERLAKMKTDLALTDDQAAKLKTIFEEQKAAVAPIMQDTTLSREQKREKAKPIMEDTKTKINAVLTPEQQAKVQAGRKERREKKKSE